MAERADLPYIVVERRSGAVVPFLWGALLGAAVAMLWAPRSGRETQRELQHAADRVGDALRGHLDSARADLAEAAEDVRRRVQDRVDAVRDAVEVRAEGVRHAVDSGRRAAQDAREELGQRVAEAKREAARPPVGDPRADVDVVVTEIVEERPSHRDPR